GSRRRRRGVRRTPASPSRLRRTARVSTAPGDEDEEIVIGGRQSAVVAAANGDVGEACSFEQQAQLLGEVQAHRQLVTLLRDEVVVHPLRRLDLQDSRLVERVDAQRSGVERTFGAYGLRGVLAS